VAGQTAQTGEREERFTVTPAQYVRFAQAGLIALSIIVATGAAVRLSGSGLGCPTWPQCYGHFYPPLQSHAVIEFGNRVLSVPLVIGAGLAWLAALRRRPYRRDLVWIGSLLPLGVVAQAVLGGLTVKGDLDYGWVMAHFCLSMLILVAAVVLVWRAKHEPGWRPGKRVDRSLVNLGRGIAAMATITIVAGTAATAAGPHGGGSPGQRINRLSFDGRGTMDFVIHRHAEIAFVFSLLALFTWWLARRRQAPPALTQPLTILVVVLALQGFVGLDQYFLKLPTELVWIHVCLATIAWITALWCLCVTETHAPQGAEQAAPAGTSGEAIGV
jgi:cytochrome c oxidase assembly protein subunit 15